MIGDAPGSTPLIVDNVISEATTTYKRVDSATLIRSRPSDLHELAQWQDEEKMQRAIDEAKLAAPCELGPTRASTAGYSTGTPISAPTTTGYFSTLRDWDQILIWKPP